MTDNIEIDGFSICTRKEASEDEMENIFEEFKNANLTLDLQNRLVDIDTEDIHNSEIIISEEPTEEYKSGPARENGLLVDNSEQIDGVHIHADFEDAFREDFAEAFSEIISNIGELELVQLTIELEADILFDELSFPAVNRTDESDFEFNGIRLSRGQNYYILQDMREFNEDDKYIGGRFLNLEDVTINEENAGSFIEDDRNHILEFLEDLS